jgi:hypothetical protein
LDVSLPCEPCACFLLVNLCNNSNLVCIFVLYDSWLIPYPVVFWLTYGSMECNMYICIYHHVKKVPNFQTLNRNLEVDLSFFSLEFMSLEISLLLSWILVLSFFINFFIFTVSYNIIHAALLNWYLLHRPVGHIPVWMHKHMLLWIAIISHHSNFLYLYCPFFTLEYH